ncbi:MAG: carboxymuconolactone decarboxylase family protein [Thermodesulfobacteriota bacterium]
MNRYEQGIKKFKEIKGDGAEKSLERLKTLNPDLEKYVMEFAFNDIYGRPALDVKSREIATIAALTALGHASQQLKVHIQSALNVGVTVEEIIEIILQMAVYAGFPAAINAMQALKEVCDEIGNNKMNSNGKGLKLVRKK